MGAPPCGTSFKHRYLAAAVVSAAPAAGAVVSAGAAVESAGGIICSVLAAGASSFLPQPSAASAKVSARRATIEREKILRIVFVFTSPQFTAPERPATAT